MRITTSVIVHILFWSNAKDVWCKQKETKLFSYIFQLLQLFTVTKLYSYQGLSPRTADFTTLSELRDSDPLQNHYVDSVEIINLVETETFPILQHVLLSQPLLPIFVHKPFALGENQRGGWLTIRGADSLC